MKTLLSLCAALVLALSAANARATDISGTWAAEMTMPDGNSFQLQFTFKLDGEALTGTILGPQGDPIAISDGKVTGDKLSFTVSFNGMTIVHEGTISAAGDEIKLSTKSDSADIPAHDMTLKRVKPPAPAPEPAAAPQP